MAPDPTGIGVSMGAGAAKGIARAIIKHYAPSLDGTGVGRGLKFIGLLDTSRADHLRVVLERALTLYFETYPEYHISGVGHFFRDPKTAQQLGNYIFDHRAIDQQVIEAALVQHINNDALSRAMLEQEGGDIKRIVPDFLACYRKALSEQADVKEQAILFRVLDATDDVNAKIGASEESLEAFVTEALQALSGNLAVLPPGRVIGRYRLQKQLTTGTFGTLYLAEQQDNGTPVVLKVVSVPAGLRLHYDVFSLGERLIDLHHPSILPTIEVSLDVIPSYVVSAYAPGGSLAQQIQQKAGHPFPLSEAFAIITQIGQALAYLHQQHIVHRGVQPASIVFDQTGKILLTGFDLAMLAPAVRHTLQSHQIGAAHYMAPEQSSGEISEKSDQYALGCIAYELCTGHRFKQVIAQPTPTQSSRSPLAPHQLNPALPIQVERAILRAVDDIPNRRYNTVEAFFAALGTP